MWIKPDADADPNGGIIGWGDFTTTTPLSARSGMTQDADGAMESAG